MLLILCIVLKTASSSEESDSFSESDHEIESPNDQAQGSQQDKSMMSKNIKLELKRIHGRVRDYTYRNQVCSEKLEIEFLEEVNFNITRSVFKKDVKFSIYQDATVNFKSTEFRGTVIFECFDDVHLNIENCKFYGEQRFVFHQFSSLIFQKNRCYKNTLFRGFQSVVGKINSCTFDAGNKLIMANSILDYQYNECKELIDVKTRGKLKLQQNNFTGNVKLHFHDKTKIIFRRNICGRNTSFEGFGKIDSFIEQCKFQKENEILFHDDASITYTNNYCADYTHVEVRGKSETKMKQCIFQGKSNFLVNDDHVITFELNTCIQKAEFHSTNEVNLHMDMNSFLTGNEILSHGMAVDKETSQTFSMKFDEMIVKNFQKFEDVAFGLVFIISVFLFLNFVLPIIFDVISYSLYHLSKLVSLETVATLFLQISVIFIVIVNVVNLISALIQ